MRRKDREITDRNRINEIISSCRCCRIGLSGEGGVYIVPLSFGFEEKAGKRIFYFHSAKEGRKLDLISKNNSVGFETDCGYKLNEAKEADEYSAAFQSVIGTGKIYFVDDAEEKLHALRCIMRQHTGKYDWEISDAMLKSTAVLRLEVEELSCKQHE